MFHTRRQFLRFSITILLMSVACRQDNGPPFEGIARPLAGASDAWSKLSAHATPNEVLVNAASIKLPFTGVSYHKGKFFSATTHETSVRAYDAATSASVDWAAKESAEHKAIRATYGAWAPEHQAQLKGFPAPVTVRATLWLKFDAAILNSSVAALAVKMSQIKAPVRAAISAQKVTEVWDDPEAPLLIVEGNAKNIETLGHHQGVGLASLHGDRYEIVNLSAGGDGQEQTDMGYSGLTRKHGNIADTSFGSIVQWDGCVPSSLVTTTSYPAWSMRYVPLANTYTTPNPPPSSFCTGGFLPGNQSHAARTMGIISARKVSTPSGLMGVYGFLRELPSIDVATLGDFDQYAPDAETQVMARISQVAAAYPLVQSWSTFFVRGGDVHPSCKGTVDAYHLYTDYKSLVRPSLHLHSAGNFAAYEGAGGGPCGAGAVWVLPKHRNGIVVGAYYDGSAVPANNTMYHNAATTTLDGYSAWRAPYGGSFANGDIRVPHVAAVGTYVQSVDHKWRAPEGGPQPASPPYVRADRQADEPLLVDSSGNWTEVVKGTSFATPQAAALAAYAMRKTRCVWGYTQTSVQTARALLIASSDRAVSVRPRGYPQENCNGSQCPTQPYRLVTGPARYDERRWAAGAGALNADRLSSLMETGCVAGNHIHGGPIPFPPDGHPTPVTGVFVTGGVAGQTRRCRVALAWHPNPSCSEFTCSESIGWDLDLWLYNNVTGTLIAHATSWDNNYEFFDVDCPALTPVRWEVTGYSGVPGSTPYFGLVHYDMAS